ncbi:MAG TPA: AraC family transcriptional regulator, partial [Polyangiales bacterium]|nr:AraC family transcriptional regulator [Polyangiales bacterium]
MHRVAVVAFDGIVPFDFAIPCDVFGMVRHTSRPDAYEVRVCGVKRVVDAGVFRIESRHGLAALARADSI